MACSTTCAFRNDALVRNSLGFGPFATAIAAATLPLASAKRKRSACGAGIVALIGDAGHGGRLAHHHAGADRRREPAVDGLDLDVVDFAGAIFPPQPAAVGGSDRWLTLVMAGHHRSDRDPD